MPLNSLTIVLDRPNRVYHQGERLSGAVVIENKYDFKHDGILLALKGSIDVHSNFRAFSFMDTFYNSQKSIPLVDTIYELVGQRKLVPGRTEIPFQVIVDGLNPRMALYETYHGVFISVQYWIKCYVKRPLLSRDLVECMEFIIEYDSNPIGAPAHLKQPIKFEITPNNLTPLVYNVVPDLKITGQLDSLRWQLTEPIEGHFVIEKCDAVIRSIELQLVRVETIGEFPNDRSYYREATEVQTIQIGDGNLLRNIDLPIHMILPRLFTCPTLVVAGSFRIEFELNLIIIFDDNHLITENFPIKLIRSTLQPINFY